MTVTLVDIADSIALSGGGLSSKERYFPKYSTRLLLQPSAEDCDNCNCVNCPSDCVCIDCNEGTYE